MRLRVTGVTRHFGGTRALHRANLEVEEGEIHALLGESGAGKTTLAHIIGGVTRPECGLLALDDEKFSPWSPAQARRRGVIVIHQELALAPDLSVEENIMLGAEPSLLGWIARRRRREIASAALHELQSTEIPLRALAGTLPLAQQQLIEIARALVTVPRVIVFDEPTSSLTHAEIRRLFQVIKQLARHGISIIFISRFFEEASELCERYTILRDGDTIASGVTATLDHTAAIEWMNGREMRDIYPQFLHKIGKPVLELCGLRGRVEPKSVDLVLHEGEIFGLAGLAGSGRSATLRTAFGIDRARGGSVFIDGSPATRRGAAYRLRRGIALLGTRRTALMLNRSVAENLTLGALHRHSAFGFVSRPSQKRAAVDWMEKLAVRAHGPDQFAADLCASNRQKIALGALLHHRARIFLLDEPAREVDLATKMQIYELIGALAADGKSVIFASSFFPELLGICTTIGVMCRGVLVETRPASRWTEHEMRNAASGERVDHDRP